MDSLQESSLVGARHRHISKDSNWCQWSGGSTRKNSASPSQLTSRFSETWKFDAGAGEDPFAKVKGVLTDLFGRCRKRLRLRPARKRFTMRRRLRQLSDVTSHGLPEWKVCWGQRACGSSAAGARWLPRSVPNRRSVRELHRVCRSAVQRFITQSQEVTHTHYTCSESAHVQRVRGVCALAVHARRLEQRKLICVLDNSEPDGR